MLKTLRTPTVFSLLTLIIVGWLSGWVVLDSAHGKFQSTRNTHSHRPLYQLAARVAGHNTSGNNITKSPPQTVKTTSHSTKWEIISSIQTKSGVYFGYLKNDGLSFDPHYNGEQVVAAGMPSQEIRYDEFGLLAPVVFRETFGPAVTQTGKFPLIDPSLAAIAYNAYETRGYGYLPTQTTTKLIWNRRALFHDSLFLLTLIAWLISLTGIPRWLIWKRLTKAQRRRAKHQCPACAYDLANLNAPICPECGDALPSSPNN